MELKPGREFSSIIKQTKVTIPEQDIMTMSKIINQTLSTRYSIKATVISQNTSKIIGQVLSHKFLVK